MADQPVFVIGSNSFSGSHMVAFLQEKGFDCVGISRSPEPNPVFLPYQHSKSFKFFQLDLNLDLDKIKNLIENCKPAYVINFAAQGMVAESWNKPEHWLTTNVVSTICLHDYLRTYPFIKKYVHISTPEVYGSCNQATPESRIYKPATPYAVSKAATDMSLHCFFQSYKFPVVFTRAANVYGPGQQLYRIIPRTILYALTGKTLHLHGGGYSERSFIHIRDVVDGTFRVMMDGRPGGIYHIATQETISIRNLVKQIVEQLGMEFDACVKDDHDRRGKDPAYRLDSSKIRRELGWQNKIDLFSGIEETIRWIRENLDILRREPQNYIHKQ